MFALRIFPGTDVALQVAGALLTHLGLGTVFYGRKVSGERRGDGRYCYRVKTQGSNTHSSPVLWTFPDLQVVITSAEADVRGIITATETDLPVVQVYDWEIKNGEFVFTTQE